MVQFSWPWVNLAFKNGALKRRQVIYYCREVVGKRNSVIRMGNKSD